MHGMAWCKRYTVGACWNMSKSKCDFISNGNKTLFNEKSILLAYSTIAASCTAQHFASVNYPYILEYAAYSDIAGIKKIWLINFIIPLVSINDVSDA